MAFISQFGCYLPSRIVNNQEIGAMVGCEADWIFNVSGIEERRFADEETVVDLATRAAEDCLRRASLSPSDVGMILLASSSSERRFPGPAVMVANRLGLHSAPCLDVPMASAGSLFAMVLASQLAPAYGNILVIAAEKMSNIILREPMERGVAILFGDGAGACLISPHSGTARIIDSVIESDGAFSEDLRLHFDSPLEMNGRTVILQASRKIPGAIQGILDRNGRLAKDVGIFLMHQANQNLISRVAQTLGVPEDRFYSNIRRYGNTSSASMLIAAAEWWQNTGIKPGLPVCFATFGAGFNWGAMLAEGVA